MRVRPVTDDDLHRKELVSEECGIMESGFNTDPAFVIIMMPDTEDKENDGVSTTKATQADVHVADSADSRPGDGQRGRDSAK